VDLVPLPTFISRPDGRLFVDQLRAGETVSVSSHIVVEKRGSYLLPLPVADSAFPFGLWRWGSRGRANRPILVYPNFTPLQQMEIPVGSQYQRVGVLETAKSGQSLEFLGCREYRYSDNPRHIHAGSWARLGQPIIKEFREEHLFRCVFIVDVYTHPVALWLRTRCASRIRGLKPPSPWQRLFHII